MAETAPSETGARKAAPYVAFDEGSVPRFGTCSSHSGRLLLNREMSSAIVSSPIPKIPPGEAFS